MSQYPRRLVERELEYFQQNQEPLNWQNPYPPPVKLVTMSHIEVFPVTQLSGISPENEEDKEDQEDEEHEEHEEETEDLEPRSLVVKLQLGTLGFERLRMREIHRRAMDTRIAHQDNTPVAQAADDQRGIMPTQTANTRLPPNPLFVPTARQTSKPNVPMASPRQTAALKARVPFLPSPNRTISAQPTPDTITNNSTILKPNMLANRTTIPNPTRVLGATSHAHPTNPSTKPQPMGTDAMTSTQTIRQIPTSTQTAVDTILAVKQNVQQLPQRMVLCNTEGFNAKGRLRADNPLRDWYGDERLFDQKTWRWLVGEKS